MKFDFLLRTMLHFHLVLPAECHVASGPALTSSWHASGAKGSGFCSTNVTMKNCHWINNTAKFGGAIYATQGCDLKVYNTTFEKNFAQVPFPRLDAILLHLGMDAAVKVTPFIFDVDFHVVECRWTAALQSWAAALPQSSAIATSLQTARLPVGAHRTRGCRSAPPHMQQQQQQQLNVARYYCI